MTHDTPWRSLVKTISWRITGSSATFAITYAVTGTLSLAGTIALAQITLNTALYWIHERIWDKVEFGRK